jgi:hypothetical protein
MLANSSITARDVASGLNPSRVIVACSALTDRFHAHQSKENKTRAFGRLAAAGFSPRYNYWRRGTIPENSEQMTLGSTR